MPRRELRVDLCTGDIRVAEILLDHAYVCSALMHVGDGTMAKNVAGTIASHARLVEIALGQTGQLPARESGATVVDEE